MADTSLLQQNEPSVTLAACQLLTKILNNVVEHPTELKYRRISTSNSNFASKVWNVIGGRQFLFSVGWTETGGIVQFEPNMPVSLLKDGLSALWVEEQLARRRQEEEWLDQMEKKVKEERLDQAGPLEAEVPKLSPADFPPAARVFFASPDEQLLPAVRLLKEALSRIVHNPNVDKFRRLNMASYRFSSALGVVPGALELLHALGFVEEATAEPPGPPATCSSSSSSSSFSSHIHPVEQEQGACRLVLPTGARIDRLRSLLLLLDDIESDITSRAFEEHAAAAVQFRSKLQAQPRPTNNRVSTEEGREAWKQENERHLTASLLISEIAALMHLVWSLEGEVGYVAHYRKEQKRLLEQFKETNNFEALHQMREEWENKLEKLKLKTGKSLISTIPQSRYVVDDIQPEAPQQPSK